ncbi:hypothetical protein [Streptomyces marianii]|uniref:hypothetical protein n=1 Tax=Streptomyces marianii TaxID=1817406 RepID=UPI0010FD9CFF|nr:hypothetical protein [Streptomyces marianii]
MNLSRVAASAAIVTAIAVTATACTSSGQPIPRTGTPSAPASAVVLSPPEIRPGYRQIASGGPRRGAWDLGPVQLAKGVSWVNVNCVADAGAGRITLVVDTVGEFTVDCPSTEARINVNQLDLAEGRRGRFHIETTDNVQWIASIQVPK